ncbi:MAG: M28 family peptidase, partial [Pseudomonadota bacterium]
MRLLFLAIMACIALLPVTASANGITEEQLRAHIDILASDAFEGRKPGTAGENKTVNYIATEWQRAGLSGGAADSGWYMEVGLVERSPIAQEVRFLRPSRNRARPVDIGDGQIVLRGAETDSLLSDVELVHAGYAAATVEQLRPQVAGKVAFLFRSGRPLVPDFPSYRERKARLIAAGARGVIAIIRGENRWLRFGRRFQRTATSLDRRGHHAEIEGMISEAGLVRLLRKTGLGPAEVTEAAGEKTFVAQPLSATASLSAETQVRRYTSHNVIGKIAGRRPDGDSLLYMGHWDHFGICGNPEEVDRICNGAVDNASGISLLIETAKRLADERPD